MIDLNHILLFVASLSALVMLGQTLRRGSLFRSWRLAAVTVLLVTGVAWLVSRETAGFIGAGAWLALLLIPAVGIRKISHLAMQERYRAARCWARPLRFLHPSAALRAQAELLGGMELAQAGNFTGALHTLESLQNAGTNVGRQAIAQSFRLRGEWEHLAGWVRAEVPPSIRHNDFGLMPLYLRALGEIGALDDLILEFATFLNSASVVHQPAWSYDLSMTMTLAFCGRLETANGRSSLRELRPALREFWTASNEISAGRSAAAETRLQKLESVTSDLLQRSEIARRLDKWRTIGQARLSPPGQALLHRIERHQRPPTSAFGSAPRRPTAAVAILIGLNLAMFVLELAFGGSTNPLTLHRLGALEPWAVRYGHEYWRMLTALFLHYGPLHLIFNLYALFVIGPGLERMIGTARFTICYLLCGLGSSAGVLLLRFANFSRPEQLVGASGCIMGVVGVWAGYLLRHRREPFAGRRLANIVLIVAVQTAFDLSTPQISMAAHLSGLVCGGLLGLVFEARPKS